ncbi:CAP domain-containing protein [Streptomyces sp. 303MFCol5.2]|uniref:CAP domain-containing protein n=1 Tax=Streptomyces sp. 303MFCol5.2 TaxID=1172181 RepID=UPI002D21B3DC|nr:CAP domain-containing protein [Streptomyces sp. 303MFCol5.2]
MPSVALACSDWEDSGGYRLDSAEWTAAKAGRSDAVRNRTKHNDRVRDWNGTGRSEPSPAASQSPTAPAGTPKPTTSKKPTAPKPKHTPTPTPTRPSSTAENTASGPQSTTPSTTPKATATATATATASAAPTSPSTSKAAAPASGTSARIVQLVNAERSKVGCSPVTLNAVLTKAAQAHSEDMATHQNMSHTGSDGSAPGDRITRAGYAWSTYGENVAYGYTTPEQVMSGWMSSPGHKANILNCAFKEVGVGLAQPGSYWTQDFASTR